MLHTPPIFMAVDLTFVEQFLTLVQPLEDAIRRHFIPVLTGTAPPNDLERNLLALPCCLGGIGIANPSTSASSKYSASRQVTKPLSDLILQQNSVYSFETLETQLQAKVDVRSSTR